jgi:putative tryptophan/tyrosine transport system substrate-binding protein
MTRRLIALLITLTLGLLVAPRGAEAQPPAKVSRVGYLSMLSRADPTYAGLREAFRQGLREHGYIEGQNLSIEWRFADGSRSRLPDLAAELVRLKVDLLFAEATPAAQAAQHATTTIPIVFSPIADPIGSGLVVSFPRPGGNLTGVTFMARELGMKRLELLKEAVPGITRVGVLSHSGNPSEATVKSLWEDTEVAAQALGVQLQRLEVQDPGGVDRAFAALARDRVDGLILFPSAMFSSERSRIVELAARQRLPVIFFFREFAEAGGLMSYGPNFPDLWRRAATYVDKILKGAKPADLPVEQPMKLELVINLKTAKELGLTMPPTLLFQADEIIR